MVHGKGKKHTVLRRLLLFAGEKGSKLLASWNTITEAEKVTANQLVRDIVKTSMETVSTST